MLRSRRILSWLWPQLAQWIWTFSGHFLDIYRSFSDLSRHVWTLPPLAIFASWPFEFLAFSSVLIISMHYNSKGSFFEEMMAHMLCSPRTRSCHQSSAHWSSHQRADAPKMDHIVQQAMRKTSKPKIQPIGDWWNVHYLGRLGPNRFVVWILKVSFPCIVLWLHFNQPDLLWAHQVLGGRGKTRLALPVNPKAQPTGLKVESFNSPHQTNHRKPTETFL